MILAMMLVISGILSIYEIYIMRTSVELILEENYKSINATEEMIEALEREDSGILETIAASHEKTAASKCGDTGQIGEKYY